LESVAMSSRIPRTSISESPAIANSGVPTWLLFTGNVVFSYASFAFRHFTKNCAYYSADYCTRPTTRQTSDDCAEYGCLR
jgi:hypothetical protein